MIYPVMREFFLNDLRWKLFSLFLAVAIWGTVHRVLNVSGSATAASADRNVTYYNQPVLVVSASADVHLYRVVPETVKVTVTGPDEAIAVLQANQIRATANLTGFEAEKDFKCNVDVSVPAGITVVSIDPQKVGVINPPPPK
jgi:YbbR domain-containing protein